MIITAYWIEHCQFYNDYFVMAQCQGFPPRPWMHVETVVRGEKLIDSHAREWGGFTISNMWPEWTKPTTRLAVNTCWLICDA